MRPCAHVKAVIDDEGAVLLDLRRGRYFALNEVGADIWRGLEAAKRPAEIERSICEIYDVDAVTAETHVAAFLEQLLRDGLVEHGD